MYGITQLPCASVRKQLGLVRELGVLLDGIVQRLGWDASDKGMPPGLSQKRWLAGRTMPSSGTVWKRGMKWNYFTSCLSGARTLHSARELMPHQLEDTGDTGRSASSMPSASAGSASAPAGC